MSPKSLYLALLITALAPAVASADGLPVPVEDAGPGGIVANDGSGRYVTINALGGTVVQRIDTHGGRILGSTSLPGRFTIPVVALDGTPAGLSYNGHKLVLIKPRTRFPRANTTLAVIDTRGLRVKRIIKLRGDFSFDAVSRDGTTVFLIKYLNPNDPTSYSVRALDPATGRLAPRPIVDPHEDADEMRGYPLDRVTSADGIWEYTLYDGGGSGRPFVHALNTEDVKAKCIDLPVLPRQFLDDGTLRIRMAGAGIEVTGAKRPLVKVDTRTFEVTPVSAKPAAAKTAKTDSSGAGAWLAAIGALLLAGGVTLSLRSRRRTRTATAA